MGASHDVVAVLRHFRFPGGAGLSGPFRKKTAGSQSSNLEILVSSSLGGMGRVFDDVLREPAPQSAIVRN